VAGERDPVRLAQLKHLSLLRYCGWGCYKAKVNSHGYKQERAAL
jgi:hypothetical protein